jgi:hypothetical protein
MRKESNLKKLASGILAGAFAFGGLVERAYAPVVMALWSEKAVWKTGEPQKLYVKADSTAEDVRNIPITAFDWNLGNTTGLIMTVQSALAPSSNDFFEGYLTIDNGLKGFGSNTRITNGPVGYGPTNRVGFVAEYTILPTQNSGGAGVKFSMGPNGGRLVSSDTTPVPYTPAAPIRSSSIKVMDNPVYASADFNQDGRVNGNDMSYFESCVSGPGIGVGTGCENADLDNDGDADQSDFGKVQRCLNGDEPANPNCVSSRTSSGDKSYNFKFDASPKREFKFDWQIA